MSPVKVTTTCDLCGEPAQRYPSFFEFLNVNEGMMRSVGVGNLCETVPPKFKVTIRGCLGPGLSVCLCSEHFGSLKLAVEQWYESGWPELVPTPEETPHYYSGL
jgi:hypothetical protein